MNLTQNPFLERELQETAFRSFLATFTGIGLIVYIISIFGDQTDLPTISIVLIQYFSVNYIGYRLLDRKFTRARILWIAGITLSICLTLLLFRNQEIYFLFALIPFLALAVSGEWKWGVISELAVSALILLFAEFQSGGVLSLTPWMAIGFGAIFVVSGSAFVQSMYETTGWSSTNYRKAREDLETVREERVGLLQVQQDYILANKEMARLTERLEAMTMMAEEARRVKEDFVARVSHELRTPLNIVIGFSEVIMQSPQQYGDCIPPALLADVDAIMRNSQHLSRLVDDILDLSQVEAGRMALTKEWSRLADIVNEAISAVKGLFDTKGLLLKKEVQPDLPVIFCDNTRIRQVIINLLGNAARFTEEGKVVVRLYQEGDHQIIAITDTGPGIPEEDQKRIFEPFQQVNSFLNRHKGGTGLGLTISKQFVEMHEGKMWIQSQLGVGTTFYFSLPIQMSPSELTQAPSMSRWFTPYIQYEPRNRPANLAPAKSLPRYIVVENEENLQRLFSRYVDNIEVVGVQKIEDAVQEAKRSPARALVCNTPIDLNTPALQEQLGNLPFGTPVISCWLPGSEEAARHLGVVEYLIKPIRRQDIMRAIHKIPNVQRILVVDDEPEILRLFVRMFSGNEKHYQIIQAMNGRRALQLLRSRKPDVMLLDMVMPEMSGFDVLKEKGKDPEIRDIPVIVISSQNPNGETGISKTLSITRGNGLSLHELLAAVQSITNILVPEEHTADPEHGGIPPERPAF